MNGKIAQQVIARTLERHPSRTDETWQLEVAITTDPGDETRQPTSTIQKVDISPVVEFIDAREAAYHGHNLLTGDMKLRLPGDLEINEKSCILCNGDQVNIVQVDAIWNGGIVEQWRVYCRRRR